MRRSSWIVIALAGLLLLPGIAAAQALVGLIPQDPARQEKQYRDLYEWNKRSLGDAYEKVGKKEARWDKPAREALEAAARYFARSIDPSTTEEDVHRLASRAVDSGCDDPLILWLDASTIHATDKRAEIERRMLKAATALEPSDYPPLRRAGALCKTAVLLTEKRVRTVNDSKEANRLLDAALALVPLTATDEASDAVTETQRYDLVMDILGGYRQNAISYKEAFDRVDVVLAKTPSLNVQRLQVKAGYSNT